MPFPGGIAALANGTLLFSIVAAFTYLLIVAEAPSWRRTAVKTLSTALLAVLVHVQAGPFALFAALVFGALGDAFLANDGEKPFLGGLASFLLAHLIYVWLFWTDGSGLQTLFAEHWRWICAAGLAIFAGAMLLRLMPAVENSLKAPVFVYVLAILLMGLTALTLQRPTVIAGAAMFIASDTILSMEKFLLAENSPHRRWAPYAVWSLYYCGQAAIALGFLL